MPQNKSLKDKAPDDTDYTIDDHPVTIGMAVWDYDLARTTVVSQEKYGNPDEPVWYRMENGKSMDGKRMWVRHPSTGEPAGR